MEMKGTFSFGNGFFMCMCMFVCLGLLTEESLSDSGVCMYAIQVCAARGMIDHEEMVEIFCEFGLRLRLKVEVEVEVESNTNALLFYSDSARIVLNFFIHESINSFIVKIEYKKHYITLPGNNR